MSRRGENIYKRKDGRWEGRVRKAGDESGGGKYISIYGKSYKEVKGKMEDLRKDPPKVKKACPYKMKEAAQIWLCDRKSCWKPTTYETYCQILDKYIIPRLGDMEIGKIDDRVMENFKQGLEREADAGLSNNYQYYICAMVQRIMLYIRRKYDNGLCVPILPVYKNKRGRVSLPGESALSALEQYVLQHIEDDTCFGIAIAIYTGIRIGELCALRWEDISLEEGVIHIKRNMQRIKATGDKKEKTEMVVLPPKTADSARIIPISPVLYGILSENWKETPGFVLSGVKNEWMDPRTLQYRFKKILKACGIDDFNFHMLRHAFATRCVSMGFDTKSLSEILGHSSVQITLSLYIHPTLQQKKRLMDQFIPYVNAGSQDVE